MSRMRRSLGPRDQLWTYELIEAQSCRRGDTPEQQLLAIFDVLHDWFNHHDDYDGCSFIKVLLEMGATHPTGQACIAYMANFRTIIRQRALAAGLLKTDEFARSFHILTKGAIISATEGDPEAPYVPRAWHVCSSNNTDTPRRPESRSGTNPPAPQRVGSLHTVIS
jgi:hypothetical protein